MSRYSILDGGNARLPPCFCPVELGRNKQASLEVPPTPRREIGVSLMPGGGVDWLRKKTRTSATFGPRRGKTVFFCRDHSVTGFFGKLFVNSLVKENNLIYAARTALIIPDVAQPPRTV